MIEVSPVSSLKEKQQPHHEHNRHHLQLTKSIILPDDEINELEIHAEEHKYNPYDIFHMQGKTIENPFCSMSCYLTTFFILLFL
jgi:hypothetical protein